MRRAAVLMAQTVAAAAISLVSGCAPIVAAVGAAPLGAAAVGDAMNTYCMLTPAARAEVRRRAGLKMQLVACPGDAGSGTGAPR